MNRKARYTRKAAALLAFCIWMPICTHAQNTVYFSTADVGLNKTVPEWGIDTAWRWDYLVRQSIVSFGGTGNVDTVRMNFFESEPLNVGLTKRLALRRCRESSRSR
jgi:hypothetical protein